MVARLTMLLSWLVIATAAVAASSPKLKPGKWEFSRIVTSVIDRGTVRTSGLPTAAQKSTSCDNDGEGFLEPRHSYCSFTQRSIVNGRINAVERCTRDQGTTTYRYTGRVSPQSFSITERMTVVDPEGVIFRDMTTQISGKRVGQCPRWWIEYRPSFRIG